MMQCGHLRVGCQEAWWSGGAPEKVVSGRGAGAHVVARGLDLEGGVHQVGNGAYAPGTLSHQPTSLPMRECV